MANTKKDEFLNIQQLQDHMSANMKQREFVCSICKNFIKNPGYVEEHMWMHLKFYECIICKGGLPDIETYKKHLEQHSENEGIEIDMTAATEIAEQRLQYSKALLRFKCRISDTEITVPAVNLTSSLQQMKRSTTTTTTTKTTTMMNTTTTNKIEAKLTKGNCQAIAKPNTLVKSKPAAGHVSKPKPKPKTKSGQNGVKKVTQVRLSSTKKTTTVMKKEYVQYVQGANMAISKVQFDELVGKVFSIIDRE